MSFSFSDPLTSGSTWKEPFLLGTLTPAELSTIFNAELGFTVTLPEEYQKHQGDSGTSISLSEFTLSVSLGSPIMDPKKTDWAALLSGGQHRTQETAPEEEVTEVPKEPIAGTCVVSQLPPNFLRRSETLEDNDRTYVRFASWPHQSRQQMLLKFCIAVSYLLFPFL
jgi:hypothetical protein